MKQWNATPLEARVAWACAHMGLLPGSVLQGMGVAQPTDTQTLAPEHVLVAARVALEIVAFAFRANGASQEDFEVAAAEASVQAFDARRKS